MKTPLPHTKTVRFLIGLSLCLLLQSVVVNAQTVNTRFRAPLLLDRAYIQTVAEQPDRKLLVYGYFDYFGSRELESSLVRITTSGSLDRTFNSDFWGEAEHIIPYKSGNILVVDGDNDDQLVLLDKRGRVIEEFDIWEIDAIKVLPDYSFIVFTEGYVVKFGSDFEVDWDFEPIEVDGSVYDIEMQGDKILIAGDFSWVGETYINDIARLNMDGSVDESFNPGNGSSDEIGSITVQPDGKILLGNSYIEEFDDYYADGRVVRLHSDGSVDTDFETDYFGYIGNVFYSNGMVVLVSEWDGEILRVNEDGTTDEGFEIEFQNYDEGFNFVLSKANEIITYNGWNAGGYGLAKFTSRGSQSRSFNPPLAEKGYIESIIPVGDKVIINGEFTTVNGTPATNLARLSSSGSVDRTYKFSSEELHSVYNVHPFSDGSLLVYSNWYGYVKLNPDGTWNQNFYFENSSVLHAWSAQQIKIVNDKILFTGWYPNYGFGVREADGSIGEFNDIYHNGYYWATSFDAQADGKILFGGNFTTINGSSSKNFVRFNTDGTIDDSYDVGTGHNGSIYKVEVLSDGGAFVEGEIGSFNGTGINGSVKLNDDGSVDGGFMDTYSDEFDPYYYNYQYPTMPFRNGFLKFGYSDNHGYWGLYHVSNDGEVTIPEDIVPGRIDVDWSPLMASSSDDRTLFLSQNIYDTYNWNEISLVKIDFPKLEPVPMSEGRIAQNTAPSYTIFPNPTADYLSFDTNEPAKVNISSLDRRVNMDTQIQGADDKIDVRNLQPGRYVIRVKVGEKVHAIHFVKK